MYYDEGSGGRQRTVVTERQGPLAGRRVVRGREVKCGARHGDKAGGWVEKGMGGGWTGTVTVHQALSSRVP